LGLGANGRPAGGYKSRMRKAVLLVVAFTWALGTFAYALINVKYTPVDLVRRSEMILRMEPGPIEDAVNGCVVVPPSADGPAAVHVLCDGGDRLIAGGADMSAKFRLTSKSKHAAWAEMDGDGRLDLFSWDAKVLKAYLMGAHGTLAETPVTMPLEACVGPASVGVGATAQSALVVAVSNAVRIVRLAGEKPSMADSQGDVTTACGPCVVEDFDGDDVNDIAQEYSAGLPLHRGREGNGPACEASAMVAPIWPEGSASAMRCGDFDGDGVRCLGARLASRSSPAFFGKPQKGPLKLTWKWAGADQSRQRAVIKPTQLELPVSGR